MLVSEVDEFLVASQAWPFSSMRWDCSVEAVRRNQLLSSSSGLGGGDVRALIGWVDEVGIWVVEAPLW